MGEVSSHSLQDIDLPNNFSATSSLKFDLDYSTCNRLNNDRKQLVLLWSWWFVWLNQLKGRTSLLGTKNEIRNEWRWNRQWIYSSSLINFVPQSLNPAIVNTTIPRDSAEIVDMFSATYDPDLHAEPQTPDMKIYLGIEFHAIENEVAHHPDYYSIEDTYLPHLSKFYSPHINWISNQLPPSPPLTQLRDLPAVSLLDKTTHVSFS